VPATDRSGERDPQKRISKEGDETLRKLLVGSAHYVLGPFGSDSNLRRHGEKIAARGGKDAKKRAAVATARKQEALGALAPPMGRWGDLRTALQRAKTRGCGGLRTATERIEAKGEVTM
jgi:hypothetical protein